jgi:hypothetical protein
MDSIKNLGILALLVVGVVFLQQRYQAHSSLENVVHQYIQDAEVVTSTYLEKDRAAQQQLVLTPIDSALMRMDEHLRAGERLDVLAKGEAVLEQDPSNLEVLLRQGIVYLQDQDHTLAYEQLKIVYDAPTSTATRAEAAWYLALLQAQTNNWSRSQRYLKDVLETHTPYRRLAEELLVLVEQRIEV